MSRRPASLLAALAVASVVPLSACFSYVETPSASPGSTVRLTLPMERTMGDGSTEPITYEGMLVEGPPLFAIERTVNRPVGHLRETEARDTVWIPTTDVRRIEVRRLSVLKTGAGVAFLGFLAAVLFDQFGAEASGG